MSERNLTRDTSHGIVGGVCAGLARYFGWTRMNFRLLYVFVSIISAAFPGILVYVLLWIFMPKD